MSVYVGARLPDRCHVTVDGAKLNPRHDLMNHSPDGFEWGYQGSGPAQLALAILAHHYGDDRAALTHYHAFKSEIVARFDRDAWSFTSDQIVNWLTGKPAVR